MAAQWAVWALVCNIGLVYLCVLWLKIILSQEPTCVVCDIREEKAPSKKTGLGHVVELEVYTTIPLEMEPTQAPGD